MDKDILIALTMHRGCHLETQVEYRIPDGKVYGTAYLVIYCHQEKGIIAEYPLGNPVEGPYHLKEEDN